VRAGLDIAVVGCGVGGMATASLLADDRHRVTVFERFAQARPLGAGLLLQPTGLAVLRELGLDEAALAAGGRIGGVDGRTARGRRVLDLNYRTLHPAAFGLGIHRGTLFELLHGRLTRSSAKLVTSAEIIAIEQDGPCAHVEDHTGSSHGPFDLVVVADGAHSNLRGRLMPEAAAPLYPWGCLWATVDDPTGAFDGLLHQRFRGTTTMMGVLPVGGGRATLFWSLPASQETVDMPTWRREAAALWPDAKRLIDGVESAASFAHATYRHVWLPGWSDGPVVFLGDAAHGTSPQLGQGANLALLDAQALARAVAEEVRLGDALARFQQRRQPNGRFYLQASHLLTPFYQSRSRLLGWLRDAFMGTACRLPLTSTMMVEILAGTRRGWLGAVRLDEDGRYPLQPAPPSGRASARSGGRSAG
jgi:2-polyprenyl-6-methoxyphenol hydroxylase-like FAD-dependent oxidoreductase